MRDALTVIKKLELRGQGDNKIFTCRCGHREKMSSFNARKKEAQKQGDRRDVQKFLAEQNKVKEAPSALAEALSKLKLEQ